MNGKMFSRYVLAVAIAAGLAATALVAQQNQSKAGAQKDAGQSGMMTGKMADQCRQMMARHNQTMADMKAMDAALDQKLAAMNAAKGKAKVDAMAAAINEMAAQRKQMMSKMTGMQDQMMAHMGEHMGQSGSPAMRQPMEQCPMMKRTGR